MTFGPYFRAGFLLSTLILVADQLSKWWVLEVLSLSEVGSMPILPILSFTLVWNEGISMGLPVNDLIGKWGTLALVSGLSLMVLYWMKSAEKKFEAMVFAIILGGALGNVIDRIVHGAVVDFIHLHAWGYNFYVFNVSDSAITIGVILFLIDGLRDGPKGPKKASKDVEVEGQPERPLKEKSE